MAKQMITLLITVNVEDPEALVEYARRRYEACWQDPSWEPVDLADAVQEALILSNENPSPDDYGIEIDYCEAQIV